MKLFEAIRLSKTKRAYHEQNEGPLPKPVIANATEYGLEFLDMSNAHRKLTWASCRSHPEALLLYQSEFWEPMDPKTGLEVLAETL